VCLAAIRTLIITPDLLLTGYLRWLLYRCIGNVIRGSYDDVPDGTEVAALLINKAVTC